MARVLEFAREMTDDEIRQAKRLCFFAHYHPRAVVADYVIHYLIALREAGFAVVVLSTADLAETEQAKLRTVNAKLIMRENTGLDFGGWIEAYGRFMPINADLLLLANDSVYGPLWPLAAFVEQLVAIPADFYGAVESWEGGPHLQSWFLLLRPSAYNAPAFRRLLGQPVPSDLPKLDIIKRYELKLLQDLTSAGLRSHAAFSAAKGGSISRALPYNPAQLLWKTLITRYGIPFIKIELLRDNPGQVGGLDAWRSIVRRSAPHLMGMIETDLAQRGAQPFKRFRERVAWSVEVDRVDYWPELHGLIARDATWRNPMLIAANRWLFERAVYRSRRMRERIRHKWGQTSI